MKREVFDKILDGRMFDVMRIKKQKMTAKNWEDLECFVGLAVGSLVSEGKTLDEVCEILTVEEILKAFPRCRCGSYKGKVQTVSMNPEFDPSPAEVFICDVCGKSDII